MLLTRDTMLIYDTRPYQQEGLNMDGGIHTTELCPICQGKLQHDENRSAFFCESHPDNAVIPKTMRVRFGAKTSKRFSNYRYTEAAQFLTALRFKKGVEKSYDPRDYQRSNPLGFWFQARIWLDIKAGTVSPKYHESLERFMAKGGEAWGYDTNVKAIRYSHVEDLLMSLKVSDKTKADMVNCYSQFFKWLEKRERVPAPDLPEIDFTLGYRQIITINQQQQIIAEIKRICPNERVYLGVKWLATYIAIRPKEMWLLRERQIDVDGYFVLPPASTKERKLKLVPMLDEDIALYRALPTGLPDMYFFRRIKDRGGYEAGGHLGRAAMYKWWKRACHHLGISGVDLYGGTRHTTASTIGEHFSMDQVRDHGTQHGTNKAFERYIRSDTKPKRQIYEKVREIQTGKVIAFKKERQG